MEIFIDSASITEINEWLKMGLLDGVTTNPSIMLRDGFYDIEKGAKEIAALVNPRSVSVEVTTNDFDEMITQARRFATWAPNLTIKIPQITQDGIPCYGVMKQLESEGIKVNATLAMSFGHVVLAAKAGATYISIFAGRMADEGGDPFKLIRIAVDWVEHWKYPSRILAASIRGIIDIQQAAVAGAHIITIPSQLLDKMADHKLTREGQRRFVEDAKRALEMMAAKKV